MQHTLCTCQGNITSPNCCRSSLPLPSCRGNHVLTRVRNRYCVIDDPIEVQNSDKECKVCGRRLAQLAVQIMAPLPRSKSEKSVCKILCWLRWAPYNQPEFLALKNIYSSGINFFLFLSVRCIGNISLLCAYRCSWRPVNNFLGQFLVLSIKTNFNDLITGTLLLLSTLFTLLRESQHQWCTKNRWGVDWLAAFM